MAEPNRIQLFQFANISPVKNIHTEFGCFFSKLLRFERYARVMPCKK